MFKVYGSVCSTVFPLTKVWVTIGLNGNVMSCPRIASSDDGRAAVSHKSMNTVIASMLLFCSSIRRVRVASSGESGNGKDGCSSRTRWLRYLTRSRSFGAWRKLSWEVAFRCPRRRPTSVRIVEYLIPLL